MQCNIDIIQFECAKLAGFIVVKVNYCFKFKFSKILEATDIYSTKEMRIKLQLLKVLLVKGVAFFGLLMPFIHKTAK
jgi:hypothetical protein